MSYDRLEMVKESFVKKSIPANVPSKKPSEYFGELVFDRDKMRKYLDAKTLASLLDCIDEVRGKDVFVLATVNNIRTLLPE